MAKNPDPAHITDASWWLMEQLLALQPGTLNGGIYADKKGYHNTRAGNARNDPSVTDKEDKGGPADKAAAYDWTFVDAQHGKYQTIAKYSGRLLASGRNPHDARLNGWREFFGQTDDDSEVEGWDFRYDRASTSDKRHLWHIHLSEDRDKVTERSNKEALLSVLRGETLDQWHLRITGIAVQQAWRWCARCEGLWFGGHPGDGACPAGGPHSRNSSGDYGLTYGPKAVGQRGWRWCRRCEGLWYGGHGSGKCPAGGGHATAGSGDYVIPAASQVTGRQHSWHWCRQCEGLWYGGHAGGSRGRCPAGGTHTYADSSNYVLNFR